ncbi:TnsA-like heteromeric transposase endonuclease subunit [Streptomyces griseofuscus]|uniref:TnsA-like heteromeric transposase endonuclease subunit n=1 Tax=Streptomyces griseofuscus TaxID=146922 RepID=UPI0033F00C55
MARELQVLHQDQFGVRRTRPAEAMAGVLLTERGEVWKPSRYPSQRSIVTWWWAATNRRLVGCRSLDRLSTAMLLDFHPEVVDFSAWSAQLIWREKGRQRQLVPDFFVRTASGQALVVLCPPQSGPGDRFERQLAVLREACQQAGWQLAAPRLPGAVALANLRWVSRRRHPRYGDAQVEAALARGPSPGRGRCWRGSTGVRCRGCWPCPGSTTCCGTGASAWTGACRCLPECWWDRWVRVNRTRCAAR